jgi:hypothetical protein
MANAGTRAPTGAGGDTQLAAVVISFVFDRTLIIVLPLLISIQVLYHFLGERDYLGWGGANCIRGREDGLRLPDFDLAIEGRTVDKGRLRLSPCELLPDDGFNVWNANGEVFGL